MSPVSDLAFQINLSWNRVFLEKHVLAVSYHMWSSGNRNFRWGTNSRLICDVICFFPMTFIGGKGDNVQFFDLTICLSLFWCSVWIRVMPFVLGIWNIFFFSRWEIKETVSKYVQYIYVSWRNWINNELRITILKITYIRFTIKCTQLFFMSNFLLSL